MNAFLSLIREPDDVKLQTESTPLRFEEKDTPSPASDRVRFHIQPDCLQVILLPGEEPVKRIRLRFRGDLSGVTLLMGDSWERCSAETLQWKAFAPHEMNAWYLYMQDGSCLHGYGVKTGGAAFAWWQADPSGLTLWLDVRNGSAGIRLNQPLLCASVVCREGSPDESPYAAAQAFCRMMCPQPNLPESPVFGFNNWYWAYGNTDHETVASQAEYLGKLCGSLSVRPFMVMDDGWQSLHTKGFNGGPWTGCNERFDDMEQMAQGIQSHGCRAGIWFRPLRTMGHVPDEAIYSSPTTYPGVVLDPTHPFSQERIARDVERIAHWGYDLIKHDFTTIDLFGRMIPEDMPLRFYDATKTNAQILSDLYRIIQRNARHSLVIGCNTVNHLAAGIHPVQRIGDDTSGRSFEWTRRYGIHSMMRLPQNGAFFTIDPDCAAFTPRVSTSLNLDFMDAMAMTGCALFASVTPGILAADEERRMRHAFETVATTPRPDWAVCGDWHRTSVPSMFCFRGQSFRYDWYRDYEGARSFLTWMN